MIKHAAIAIEAAVKAGKEIMKIYQKDDFQIVSKADNSPLTNADSKANKIINSFLQPTHIPIISEENIQPPYKERKYWESCWIVDPLDGTKEFIKKNGEFTVNIAYIEKKMPVFGVIYVPATKIIYFGDVSLGKSFKYKIKQSENWESIFKSAEEIYPKKLAGKIRVACSRSHINKKTEDYISSLRINQNKVVVTHSRGSSLKFCMIAEGLADVYPRFSATMEWDTAAGQAICNAVGLDVRDKQTNKNMCYNREVLENKNFLISNFY